MAAKGPSHRMQGLLAEFKNLYENRLKKLKSDNQAIRQKINDDDDEGGGSGNIGTSCKEDTVLTFQSYEVRFNFFWKWHMVT